MLYVIDTREWEEEEEIRQQCLLNDVQFQPGFFLELTKTKLASKLLKKAIASEHDISMSLLKTGINGKPEFDGNPVYFNISHHGPMAIAITSTSQPVGIDISDPVSPFDDEELLQLFSTLPATYHQGFYWAARETYLKYTAQGSREAPVAVKAPSHSGAPDLKLMGPLAVMPLIYVEDTFARIFRLGEFVGAVIAPLSDISEIRFFSTEPKDSNKQASV